MKCHFCEQDCIKSKYSLGYTTCLNHFMEINYFSEGTGYALFHHDEESMFMIQIFFNENKKCHVWSSDGKHFILNTSPKFNPNENVEDKIKKLLAFI